MQKLLNSILRNRTLLLFILLLALSLRYMARNHYYQRTNFQALNNATLAPFFEARHRFFSYFKLLREKFDLIVIALSLSGIDFIGKELKRYKIKTLHKTLYNLNTKNNISSKYKKEQKYYADCAKKNIKPVKKL